MNTPEEKAFNEVWTELKSAREKFKAMDSGHYGYAVILEELDEMWDAIKVNDLTHAREEARQVAAMAIRFMLEV